MSGFADILAGPGTPEFLGLSKNMYAISIFLGGLVLLTMGIVAGVHATDTNDSGVRALAVVAMNLFIATVVFSPAMYRVTGALVSLIPGSSAFRNGAWATVDGSPRVVGFFGHVLVFFLLTYFFTNNAIAA
jgi:hypothetical protein